MTALWQASDLGRWVLHSSNPGVQRLLNRQDDRVSPFDHPSRVVTVMAAIPGLQRSGQPRSLAWRTKFPRRRHRDSNGLPPGKPLKLYWRTRVWRQPFSIRRCRPVLTHRLRHLRPRQARRLRRSTRSLKSSLELLGTPSLPFTSAHLLDRGASLAACLCHEGRATTPDSNLLLQRSLPKQ